MSGALDDLGAFALGDVIDEPALAARGAQGFIWRVTTTTGTYAVKRLQPWVEPEPVPFDIALQLAARAAGVPMPAPVLAPDGRAVAGRTRVYEWVDLGPPLARPVTVERAAEAGDLLGRIHRLGVPPAGETPAWFLVPAPETAWRQVIADARAAIVRSEWIDVVEAELPALLDIGRRFTVTPTRPVITCHADFWPANVLPSAVDGRLVVLDWENAVPLTADAEVGAVLIDWVTDDGGEVDVDAARALLAAYADDHLAIDESSFARWVVTALNYLLILLEQLVYEREGHDPAYAEATLPEASPAMIHAAVRAVDVLVRTCAR